MAKEETQENKDKVKAFMKDLQELLIKHKADIGFNVGEHSDTYGLYDERIVATVDGVDITLNHGWYVDASELGPIPE
jgi:hypothetical protein